MAFKGFGLGLGRQFKNIRNREAFEGFGLGIMSRLTNGFGSGYVPPRLVLHNKCHQLFLEEKYSDFADHIERLCKQYPEEQDILSKWMQKAADKRENADCLRAFLLCYDVLGDEHPRSKVLVREYGEGLFEGKPEAPRTEVQAVPEVIPKTDLLSTIKKTEPTKSVDSGTDDLFVPNVSHEQSGTFVKDSGLSEYQLALRTFLKSIEDFKCYSLFKASKIDARFFEKLNQQLVLDGSSLDLLRLSEKFADKNWVATDESIELIREGTKTDVLFQFCKKMILFVYTTRDENQFHSVVRLSILLLGCDSTLVFRLFVELTSHLPAMERHSIVGFVPIIESIKNETAPKWVNEPSNWHVLLEDLTDWNPLDLELFEHIPNSAFPLPKSLCNHLFGNKYFRKHFTGKTKAQKSSFFMKLSEHCAKYMEKSSYGYLVSALFVLRNIDQKRGAAFLEASTSDDKAVYAIDVILEALASSSELHEHLDQFLPIFHSAIEKDAKYSAKILNILSQCGAHVQVMNLVKQLSVSDTNWKNELKACLPQNLERSFHGIADLKCDGSVLVLTDLSLSLSQIRRLNYSSSMTFYNVKGTLPEGDIQDGFVNIIDGSNLNDDQKYIRELTKLSEVVSFSLSQKFISTIKDEQLSNVFRDLEAALYASIRARTIGFIRKFELLTYWQRTDCEKYEKIIVLSSDPNLYARVVESLDRHDLSAKVVSCFIPRKKGAGKVFNDRIRTLRQSNGRSGVKHEINVLKKQPALQFEQVLREMYANCEGQFIDQSPSDGVLFVNRMSAKTVPGTVLPVMKKLLDTQHVKMIDIQTSKDATIEVSLSPPKQTKFERLSTRQIKSTSAQVIPNAEDALKHWCRNEFAHSGKVLLGPSGEKYFEELFSSELGIDWANVSYLMTLQKSVASVLDESSEGCVMVSPGRSVEAYCAQHMAARRGILSIELVNAWLSDQYTYATPRGDIVTAIDDWTEKLLVQSFGIDSAEVKKVGTPRYDDLYHRAKRMKREDCQKNLGLTLGKPTICVALQPISMEINTKILEGVFGGLDSSRAVNVLIKPHPRENESRLNEYRKVAEKYNNLRLVDTTLLPQSDIIECLIASDICITAFSNVGVEAALCERDTILCQFPGMESPIKLDEMGLGYPTRSVSELSSVLVDVLDGGETLRQIRSNRSDFYAVNQQFIQSIASDEIIALMNSKDLIGAGARRHLLAKDTRATFDAS